MTNNRLQGWNPQKLAFTYSKDREFGSGLRGGALHADLGLAEATGDTYFLPARILHNETRVSEDYSVVQVYGPANAATEQLTPEIIQ